MEHGPDLLFAGFIYAACLISFFSFNTLMKERRETNRLNKELTESNRQLKEYAEKVEDLAVSKERNRVAQEIHDSLGHSLTALIMHLDFLEKIIDNDREKAREVVIKTQSMARDSMGVLRSAVYALKEDRHTKGLTDSVNELISKITSVEGIDIDFLSTGNIEKVSLDIKNMVYRTIQEGVTNGIKHGKATKFKISITSDNNYFTLLFKDNGLGCSGPVKGNGLNGIEERVNALGGDVSYLNEDGFGFNISIPIEEAIS
jgi:signal transduction histidine kinase